MCGCTAQFVPDRVRSPKDMFSHGVAQNTVIIVLAKLATIECSCDREYLRSVVIEFAQFGQSICSVSLERLQITHVKYGS